MGIATRALRPGDLLWLAADLDASFSCDSHLVLTCSGKGLEVGWHLAEERLDRTFQKRYPLGRQDLSELRELLRLQEGLQQLAVHRDANGTESMAGLLDVRPQSWNQTAVIWNLMVDRRFQRQGIGRRLLHEAIQWAEEQGFRAIRLETQNTNVPACRFYLAHGFELTGLDRAFYAPKPNQPQEIALFFSRNLTSA
jgi:ribosomal protein S18 acetylase RimI-like enzyme